MAQSQLAKTVVEAITPKQIRELRMLLSSDGAKPISQQRLGQLLDVSWNTVNRWESGGRPDDRTALRLERLYAVVRELSQVVASRNRLAFLEKEHPLLLHMRPINMLMDEQGTQRVLETIEGAASGSFA
ncbi:MAG: helix-turn-helix transcriptional regulator [Acidobacteriales bacterium]|nr:helix-turn-helix transcriptional regulator [Terriglobales bacterium]